MSYEPVSKVDINGPHDSLQTSSSQQSDAQSHAPSNQYDLFAQMKTSFRSLSNSPRELYLTFLLKFCEAYGYFSLSQILVIYLHNEFDCSDMEAGTAYGLWGASIIFWGFATSCFNDQLGVRRSLLIGFSMSSISSLLLGFARTKGLVYATLFCILPIGNCMGMPMLTIGIKRYTTSANRGFAFGLYYAAMNVAALASGPVVDFFNIAIPSNESFSGNRMVILTNTFIYLSSWLITYFWLREIRVKDDDLEDDAPPVDTVTSALQHAPYSTVDVDLEHEYELTALPPVPGTMIRHRSISSDAEGESGRVDNPLLSSSSARGTSTDVTHEDVVSIPRAHVERSDERRTFNTLEIIGDLAYSKTFWRFVVFTLFLINLRTIFRHVDATLPTYLIRCFGPNYPKGMIYSINPFLIIWLTPIVAAMTSHWAHFDMIKFGGYVSAVSPFFVACSTSTWAVVMFMIVLSFGEAIWSPRLYDYTMSIAPEVPQNTLPLFSHPAPITLPICVWIG